MKKKSTRQAIILAFFLFGLPFIGASISMVVFPVNKESRVFAVQNHFITKAQYDLWSKNNK